MNPRHPKQHTGLRTIAAMAVCLAVCSLATLPASAQNCAAPEIPDVFTPNNDGFNDVLVIGCLNVFPDNHLTVYNRWGQIVYEAFDYDNNWNGDHHIDKGPLPAATYIYTLKIQLSDSERNYSGTITLVR